MASFTATETDTDPDVDPELDPDTETEGVPGAPTRRRRRVSKWRRFKKKAKKWGIRALIALTVLILLLLLILWLILDRIDRIDALDGARPANAKGQTILFLGLDRRSDVQTTGRNARGDAFVPGAQRADMIMLLHITEDRNDAYGVSIPRDSWVDIPGHGKNKINAAYSFGGPKLMVQTVQAVTGVHIDHVAVADFEGFRQLTDAVGGVDVYFPQAVPIPGVGTWPQGLVHLDGELALAYVKQRYGLPNGDFDRIHRQQEFLRQLSVKLTSDRVLSNPLRVKKILDHVAANVTVDDEFGTGEMMRLAWSLRGFDPGNLTFYTVPNQGTGFAGAASIVVYDAKAAKGMWKAFAEENLDVLGRRYAPLSLDAATLP